jgi:hypothetical protein
MRGLIPLPWRDRVEVYGAKQVAMIGQRERGHPELARPVGQPVDPACPVQEAVIRMDMEMDEILLDGRHARVNQDQRAGGASRKRCEEAG